MTRLLSFFKVIRASLGPESLPALCAAVVNPECEPECELGGACHFGYSPPPAYTGTFVCLGN